MQFINQVSPNSNESIKEVNKEMAEINLTLYTDNINKNPSSASDQID